MAMRLHDTLTRQLVAVEPLEPGHVRLYTCGPTVYARVHVGNFRTFVFEDVLRRWLERRFDRVTHVMNLTDVEDKIIRNATAAGRTLAAETAPHIEGFFTDLDALDIRHAHHYPRATDYIDAMLEIIDRLDERGLTYTSDDSVYFRIANFPRYGRLSGVQGRGLVAGASGRVDADEYDKDEARDFALWKACSPDEIGWDTRRGRGRPGWHIECSAMSMSLLGESFDIHCGGVDNIFPHHENEIAQSEGATGKPFVRIWCHSAHLRIGGEKMAKSAGNFSTLEEMLVDGVRPSAIRYMLAAAAKYRQPLHYTPDALHTAAEAVDRLVTFRDRVRSTAAGGNDACELHLIVETAMRDFTTAMDDDLNLPEAMGTVFGLIRAVNRELDRGGMGPRLRERLLDFMSDVDDILGVLPLVDRERSGGVGAEAQALLDQRAAARTAGDFAASDRLRAQLAALGVAVEDTAQGQRSRRVAG